MHKWLVVLVLLMTTAAWGQWTEPVPMEPQFGSGFRAPWISNDGLRLYLCTMADINVTARDSIGAPWGPLVRLPDHINASPTQKSACESPSGDTLYFISDSDYRPEGGFGWLDVYYSVRTDTGWGPVVNCGPHINGPGREWSVGISRDGSTLLVSSSGPQGGYPDLYYCPKQPDGTWGIPVDFGPNINTMNEEESPCLSLDNNRLLFSSDGPNMGDIYESWKVDDAWQRATALPAPVNSQMGTEMSPCLAADGRTLWFRKSPYHGEFMIYTSEDTMVSSSRGDGVGPLGSSPCPGLIIMDAAAGRLELILNGVRAAGEKRVCLFNLLGQKVHESVVTFSPNSAGPVGALRVGHLAAGSYLVTVRDGETTLSARYTLVK